MGLPWEVDPLKSSNVSHRTHHLFSPIGGRFVDYWRSFDVVFVRKDFVGSKREMSPNRARHYPLESSGFFPEALQTSQRIGRTMLGHICNFCGWLSVVMAMSEETLWTRAYGDEYWAGPPLHI